MAGFSIHHFRFHLEPKAALHMPAYNKGSTLRLTPKGNVIRRGFGARFACLRATHRQGGSCVMGDLESRVRDRGASVWRRSGGFVEGELKRSPSFCERRERHMKAKKKILTAEILQEIVRRIVAAVQPEKIILFGSAAREEMGPDSDLGE